MLQDNKTKYYLKNRLGSLQLDAHQKVKCARFSLAVSLKKKSDNDVQDERCIDLCLTYLSLQNLFRLTYVHSSQQGHLSTEPHCQSSIEFGYKVDSIGHTELHKCSPHTDKYASLLFGLVDNVFHLHVLYSHTDQSPVSLAPCSGATGLKKSNHDTIFLGGFLSCYITR